jgi:hypothetical protein
MSPVAGSAPLTGKSQIFQCQVEMLTATAALSALSYAMLVVPVTPPVCQLNG